MVNDDNALIERLFAMADEYDSGHHESWPTIDALEIAAHRIEALSAENERLREVLDRLTEASSKTLTEMVSRGNALETLEAENEWLRERIERLRKALYAAYDDEPGWCDLTRAALGET